ncbi:hypothetical protein [Corynebacterium glaucum]|uniref:hypothetical protein n=1 Tax=Corynebacterium glaucum TaxID=187491 RepID=UPI0026586443|nr:hypothetical protein [Corynebacterium glaucum]
MTEQADLSQKTQPRRKINWLAVGAIISFACVFGFAKFTVPATVAAFVLTIVLTFSSVFLRGREMISVFIATVLSMLLVIIAVFVGLVRFGAYQHGGPISALGVG